MLVFQKHFTLFRCGRQAALGLADGCFNMFINEMAAPSVEVVQSIRVMGVLALIAVLALWITGYLLSGMIYGGLPTSGAFHAKLTGATLILICSLGANLETLRSMRAALHRGRALWRFCMDCADITVGGVDWAAAAFSSN